MDFNPKRETLFALLAAVIALLAYSQFFGIELAEFDTVAKLTSYTNPDISEVARIFTQPEQFYTNHSTNYRPVESLIFWVTFIFQGFNLKAFHLVNFLFHAVWLTSCIFGSLIHKRIS